MRQGFFMIFAVARSGARRWNFKRVQYACLSRRRCVQSDSPDPETLTKLMMMMMFILYYKPEPLITMTSDANLEN